MENFLKQHESYLALQYTDMADSLGRLSKISPKLAQKYKTRIESKSHHPYKLMKALLSEIMSAQEQGFISP